MSRLYFLTDAQMQELRRLLRKVDGLNGPGVTNAPDSISVHRPPGDGPGRDGGQPRHAPGPTPPRMFRVTGSADAGGGRVTYTAKRQTRVKSAAGYGGWADDPNDTGDYTLYAPGEDLTPGSSTHEADAIVAAVRVPVSGEDAEWWIVDAAGGGLPEGTGQYKVLQLDANDEPHWDYVRAH